jgi:hypothetical protein
MQLFPDISYRPHEHVVLARWLQPATDYAHFQASFYQVLEKAVQYDCQYWLLDVRRCPPRCTQQQQWLQQEFYPHAKAKFQLLGPIHEAYLVHPAHLTHYTAVALPQSQPVASTCYQTAAFVDEGLTTAWLRQQAAHHRPPCGCS